MNEGNINEHNYVWDAFSNFQILKKFTAPQAAYNYVLKIIDNLTTTYTPFNSVIRSQDTIYRLEIKDILRLKATTNPTYPDNDIRMVSVDIPTLVGIPESQSMTNNVDPRVFGTSNWCRALLNTTDYFAFELKCDIDSSQPRIL